MRKVYFNGERVISSEFAIVPDSELEEAAEAILSGSGEYNLRGLGVNSPVKGARLVQSSGGPRQISWERSERDSPEQ